MKPRTATITIITSLAGTCSIAHAQSYWTTQTGFWHVPTNWDTGTTPTESDTAIIANGGTATVRGTINAGGGIFGLDNGGQFNDGTVIVEGGSLNFTGFGAAIFGRDAGTSGNLVLEENSSLTCRSTLEFGWMGDSLATINQGSFVEAYAINVAGRRYAPGRTFSATASLDVAGQGTLIRTTTDSNANGMVIGAGGSAQVTIRDGARIETTDALLLSTTSEGSNLIIEGPDSSLQVSGGFFDTGRDITLSDDHPPVGDAVLTLRNGGTLDASKTSRAMVLFSQTRIEGTGTLMGDAYFYQGSTIDPGEHNEYGHLSFTHQLDSVLDFNSNITGGTFHFDIGSTKNFDQLTVHDLIAGGTLEVGIADDFVAQFGQSFDIITADTLTGDFDLITLPELQGSLSFETEIHTQGVTLHVVPAPSSLIAIALPMLALNRRRT